MPIFHDPDHPPPEGPQDSPPRPPPTAMRKPSEESIRTEFLDGPLPNSHVAMQPAAATGPQLDPTTDGNLGISDRTELIERIKRGESPTWLPGRTLEDYFHNHDDPPSKRPPLPYSPKINQLLPAAELQERSQPASPDHEDRIRQAADIERPRSALHAGDFTHESNDDAGQNSHRLSLDSDFQPERIPTAVYGSSSTAPWYTPQSSPAFAPFPSQPPFNHTSPDRSLYRSRAPSLSSYSSSFVFRAPTSPLVQTSNNNDTDGSSGTHTIGISTSPSKGSRRHTLPPHALLSLQSSPPGQLPTSNLSRRPLPTARQEFTAPYQAHQPRRSLTSSLNIHSNSSPQTPAFLRSRRPSLSSDVSPLHHAPMVGSYEESILRGRMSTVPSKPLNFVAQIGVLGLGNCKPNLRCPAHVSVPFPAVFYSYGTANVGRMPSLEDGPSPYVGLIDIENALGKPNEGKEDRRKRRSATPSASYAPFQDCDMIDIESQATQTLSELELRKREKKKRRSASPKAPPGGSYRIPQKGQLQIVIKNPNKTAVKLFLVPYDLQGMEPGTKTFIRQRSYSTGPIIDMPLGSRPESPASGLQGSGTSWTEPADRPTLRYLIHLHICCPSRGRFYLYKSIRVVFANRVPDGKEKLRNEIQLPEPRYSTYKHDRDSNVGPTSSAHASGMSDLNAAKALRRRSAGFGMGAAGLDALDGIGMHDEPATFSGNDPYSYSRTSPSAPIQPIPFNLVRHSKIRPAPTGQSENMELDLASRSVAALTSRIRTPPPALPSASMATSARPPNALTSPPASSVFFSGSWKSSSTGSSNSGAYGKLSKGDVGYGGNAFSGTGSDGSEAGEGLLAKRLRGLDVQRHLTGPGEQGMPDE